MQPDASLPTAHRLLQAHHLLTGRAGGGRPLEYALTHELWHYKRRDLWKKLLPMAAGAVHWSNPVLWYMPRQMEQDLEQACDSDVLRHADSLSRRQHSFTMLSFIETPAIPLTTNFHRDSGKQTKQRFINIMSVGKRRKGLVLLCVLAVALLVCSIWSGTRNSLAPGDVPAWPDPGYYEINADSVYEGITIVGEDIYGTSVVVVDSGRVIATMDDENDDAGTATSGEYIEVYHDDKTITRYSHLSSIDVKLGESVEKGQSVGQVGSTGAFITGPQLGFQVQTQGTADPRSAGEPC